MTNNTIHHRDMNRNFIVPAHDIPALAGILGAFLGHMEEVADQVPGSLKPAIGMMTDAADRMLAAIREGR